ncbi:MAG: OmpA family protein [Labilithrix sp.]|nr:OmpA family protein [Labilithrix sp.]MCW5817804.1 OmpA family protein [Labilithrix sp.]
MKSLLGAVALVGATLYSETASAQRVLEGFAVQKFEPSERGSEWFGNESLDLRGKIRPAVGVVSDFSRRSLIIFEDNDNVRGSVIRNQVFLHPGGSLVLFDRLRLAVNVPIQVFVDGNSATVFRDETGAGVVTTSFAEPANSSAMGDLRFGADVRLAGVYGDPFTVAAGLQVWAPTGSTANYASDGHARLKPRVMVAGDIGAFTYAGSVGVNFRTRGYERMGPAGIGHELNLTAALGAKVLDKTLTVGPEMWMSSVMTNNRFLEKKWTPLEVGAGAHYLIANQVRVGAALMGGPVRAWSNPVYRIIAMAEWAPGVVDDRDGDGIPDNEDACPDQKGVRSAEPSRNGCPEVAPQQVAGPTDRDNDGIPDQQDACPDVPGVKTDDPTTNGCRDTDGDGFFDPKDACPTEKGIASQDPMTNGCPDTDGDGIFDKVDACPTEAGPKSEDPKKNGCPIGDKDKDGIKDDVDACPDEPGPASPDPKRNGCPMAFISQGQIKILDQVKFKTGSAAIENGKDSEEVLEAVRAVLQTHTEIKKIRIEGHTDNKGAAAMNKKLSADRAASVKTWLVKKGIAADRMSTTGFGLEKPIDTNETETGRKNNRRVEFHIE